MICRICGTSFIPSSRGRPREYCSLNCQEFYKFYSQMEDRLFNISFSSSSCVSLMRGDFFRLANSIKKF